MTSHKALPARACLPFPRLWPFFELCPPILPPPMSKLFLSGSVKMYVAKATLQTGVEAKTAILALGINHWQTHSAHTAWQMPETCALLPDFSAIFYWR